MLDEGNRRIIENSRRDAIRYIGKAGRVQSRWEVPRAKDRRSFEGEGARRSRSSAKGIVSVDGQVERANGRRKARVGRVVSKGVFRDEKHRTPVTTTRSFPFFRPIVRRERSRRRPSSLLSTGNEVFPAPLSSGRA
ncbi:hypothetical protein KM043_002084 [Ampulex compressa]|nr:hypothetical protein KM043_002084 [Ampulex compressa]